MAHLEIVVSMVAFAGLVVSWFALPAVPHTAEIAITAADAMPTAA